MSRSLLLAYLTMGLGAGLGTGCSPSAADAPPPPPPSVTVSSALERDVTDYADFTGRIAAVESVVVRARVWGHLQKISFDEGGTVKKDDVLFVIDQKPYLATLARAEADVAQVEARVKRLEGDYGRGQDLIRTNAISREEFEKIAGDLSEARATRRGAVAARDAAKLNLEYTEVKAPVSGHAGRALATVGNLVQSGETGGTALTTIVSVDPVYAYFDVDDQTYVRIRHLIREARGKSGSGAVPPVLLALSHETDFPHRGAIDFLDNQVDPSTGTMKVRVVVANKGGTLTPGLFVRVHVPLGRQHRAVLVSERAVETDQGQKVVYVVGKGEVAERRPVQLGGLHGGLREVLAGLRPGERVVVEGLQRVRAGVEVQPRLVDMPDGR